MIKNKIITICAVLLSLIQPLPSVSNGITANNISSSKSTTIQSPEKVQAVKNTIQPTMTKAMSWTSKRHQ